MSAQDPKKPIAAPHPDESEVLLGRIMSDLDLPHTGAEQRRQYHNAARMRFLLPRITLTVAAVLALSLLLLLLLRPIEVRQMQQQMADDGVTPQVAVTVHGPLFLQVTARLNGTPVAVEHRYGSAYTVKARRNGTLMVIVRPLAGRTVTRTMTVSGADEERPHIVSDRRVGDAVEIFITDGDGSGVDWAGITAELDSGAAFTDFVVDEAAGSVRLPMPSGKLHLTVPDRCGNTLHATLTPDGAG